MLTYQNKKFCPYHEQCQQGNECDMALTKEVKQAAYDWWAAEAGRVNQYNAPIDVLVQVPECFVYKKE